MILNIVLLFLFKLILDYTFVHSVSPVYAYAGLVTDISSEKVILSYALLGVMTLLLPSHNKKPSDFAQLLLFVFVIIPVLSLWGLQNEASGFVALVVTSFVLLQLLMKLRFTRLVVPDVYQGERIYSIVAWTLVGTLFFALIARGGLHYLNLNFLKVYKLRDIISETLLQGGWAYLWIWCGKSFLIILMGVALWKRHWPVFIATFALEVLLFALTTHKELLFYPVIVTFVYWISMNGYRLSRIFIVGLCGVLVTAVLLDSVTANHLFLGVLVYRTFDVIGYNHFAYYHFFSENPYVKFSNGILSRVFHYPYSEPVPLLIGAGRYGADSDSYANTGYIASGYMQLGAAGVFLYTFAVAAIMKMFDMLTIGRMPVWLGTSVAAISIYQLVNTDLTTALLTHGIAISLLGIWLVGSARKQSLHGAEPQALTNV